MMRKKERIHIILRMCNVSYGRLLYIETFYSILSFCLQTTEALIGLCGCAGWLGLRYLQMPEDTFAHGAARIMLFDSLFVIVHQYNMSVS